MSFSQPFLTVWLKKSQFTIYDIQHLLKPCPSYRNFCLIKILLISFSFLQIKTLFSTFPNQSFLIKESCICIFLYLCWLSKGKFVSKYTQRLGFQQFFSHIKYLVHLIEHPILWILNFNFPNLRCCKVFFSF